jgi:hypothetical protein
VISSVRLPDGLRVELSRWTDSGMPLDTYREWKRRNAQIGCVFARRMAAKPNDYGQRGEIVHGNDPAAVAHAIATRITVFVDDPVTQAATLVFPDVNDLGSVAQVALSLAGHPNWRVTRTLLAGTPAGNVIAFNIVREIPMIPLPPGSGPSEALVLGPFPEFPATRRAPLVALEMFVGSPPAQKLDGTPTTKAHLADVQMYFPTKAAFDSTLTDTRAERLQSLGGIDDRRAKAKVSFSIPIPLATALGCMP